MSSTRGNIRIEVDVPPADTRSILEAHTAQGPARDLSKGVLKAFWASGPEHFLQFSPDGRFVLEAAGYGTPWCMGWFRVEGRVRPSLPNGSVITCEVRPSQAQYVLWILPLVFGIGVVASWLAQSITFWHLLCLTPGVLLLGALPYCVRRLCLGSATQRYVSFLRETLGVHVRDGRLQAD